MAAVTAAITPTPVVNDGLGRPGAAHPDPAL